MKVLYLTRIDKLTIVKDENNKYFTYLCEVARMLDVDYSILAHYLKTKLLTCLNAPAWKTRTLNNRRMISVVAASSFIFHQSSKGNVRAGTIRALLLKEPLVDKCEELFELSDNFIQQNQGMSKRDEIINFFLKNKNKWFFVSDIAKACNCAISTARHCVKDLVDEEYTINGCQIIGQRTAFRRRCWYACTFRGTNEA
ncbi:hypothetical protein [Scytonema sp. NUACC26]|uniref:hypothetical protein n=1 Tax=Scytonema sp. NUACC26 TaxID=3140176 RepID=UPI0034DB8135